MKKKIILTVCVVAVSAFIMSCSSSKSEAAPAPADAQEQTQTQTPTFTTYEEVFNEYSSLIKQLAPALVAEYQSQEKEMNGDMDKLAQLCNEKVQILSVINNEGIEYMARIMRENNDSVEVYEEWAGKLYDVYMEESSRISNAYMSSFGL